MSFNALFSNQQPSSPSPRTTTPQPQKKNNNNNKARCLEARASRRTPRGKERSKTLPPERTKLTATSTPTPAPTALVAISTKSPRVPSTPKKASSSPPERWASGLVSPPPSALPIPCFDDDDAAGVAAPTIDVTRPVSAPSVQRQLVFV